MRFDLEGINNVEKVNLFIRCLWSELRVNDANFAWNYFPYKDKQDKEFMVGILSCSNLQKNYTVSIGYKSKGIITYIKFESETGDDSDDKITIKNAILSALKNDSQVKTFTYRGAYKTPNIGIENYKGENFIIKKSNDKNKFNIDIKLSAFDKSDAMKRMKKICREIISFLSVCTNQVFYITDKLDSGLSENYNIYKNDKWIDGVSDKITEKSTLFIDKIITNKIDESEEQFLKACYIYSYANKYYSLRYNYGFYDFSMMDLEIYNEELMIVLYMTALESISIINNNNSKKCEECGQPVFSIGKKVINLCNKYGGGYAYDKLIKDYYSQRSKFVHMGDVISINNYIGHMNPEFIIKNGEFKLEEELPLINLTFIKEYVGYILRNYFEEEILIKQ